MADSDVKKAPAAAAPAAKAAPAAAAAAQKVVRPKRVNDIKKALKRGRVPLPKPKRTGDKLPAVPETILKRRKLKGQLKNHAVQLALKKKIQARRKSKQAFRRAETYIKKYRAMEKEQIRLKRQAKKEGTVLVPGEAKLAFVIRIRGINQIHPKVRKVLQLLRLRQINNAVIERQLGKQGIICIEDMVHEIYTQGKNFTKV